MRASTLAPRRTSVSDQPSAQAAINQRNYEKAAVVRDYQTDLLRPAEVMVFVRYRDQFMGRRVLEIGCGAGRVTRYLDRWTTRCVGIDSSEAMISLCRGLLPHMTLLRCDARDLGHFESESFDSALFTFNGIDAMEHWDRIRVLEGLHRVLRLGGLWVFSSHNRRCRFARRGPRLGASLNPATMFRNGVSFARSVKNRLQLRSMEREEEEYALINDVAHDFRMLHYYIDRERQSAQLARTGFAVVEVYGEDGGALGPGDDDSEYSELYYVARRS